MDIVSIKKELQGYCDHCLCVTSYTSHQLQVIKWLAIDQ